MTRVIVLIIAMLIPTAAFAKSDCADDVEKYCKGLNSREQVNTCLDTNPEVSPACKARREAMKNCAGDIEKLCKDVKRKEVDACLDQHQAELTPACKTSREAMQ